MSASQPFRKGSGDNIFTTPIYSLKYLKKSKKRSTWSGLLGCIYNLKVEYFHNVTYRCLHSLHKSFRTCIQHKYQRFTNYHGTWLIYWVMRCRSRAQQNSKYDMI
jgi:hypothetical protein